MRKFDQLDLEISIDINREMHIELKEELDCTIDEKATRSIHPKSAVRDSTSRILILLS
jgi:hypothetical protein